MSFVKPDIFKHRSSKFVYSTRHKEDVTLAAQLELNTIPTHTKLKYSLHPVALVCKTNRF